MANALPSRAIKPLIAATSGCNSCGCASSAIGSSASTLRDVTSPAALDSGARPRRNASASKAATAASVSSAGSTSADAVARASDSRSIARCAACTMRSSCTIV